MVKLGFISCGLDYSNNILPVLPGKKLFSWTNIRQWDNILHVSSETCRILAFEDQDWTPWSKLLS